MSNDKIRARHSEQPSALEAFRLSFEYDVTWTDARKSIKQRTS